MKTAGLSIEGTRLRVTIMKGALGFYSHVKSEEHSLPQNPVDRPAAIQELLLSLKAGYAIKAFSVGLDMSLFTFKIIELPCVTREDIASALEFELENHLPLPPDEYRYDFVTLSNDEASSKNLMMAIKREKLAWLAQCVEETGLKLLSVRCTGVEILNELLSHRDSHHSMLIQQSSENFHIIGLEHGKPVYLKTAYGLPDAITRVTEIMPSFKGIYTMGVSDVTEFSALGAMSIAYDLSAMVAQADLKRRQLKMCFTPEALIPIKLDLFPYVAGGLATLCVLLYLATSAVAYYKDRHALGLVNTWLKELEQTSHELLQTKKEIEAVMEKRQFLTSYKARSERNIAYIRELSNVLPKSAWLVSFNIDGKGKIDIEGYATRTAEIIGPLENSPLFKNVEITAPVLLREGIERFSIRMELEG